MAGTNYVVVLAKGDKLMESLRQFVKQSNIATAWLQGLGAAMEVELAYYDLDAQEYKWKAFTGPLEITNLQGNIAQKQGQPVFHIHGTFAQSNYGSVGGHLKELTVGATCEILVQKVDAKLTRQRDDAVGLELLQPES